MKVSLIVAVYKDVRALELILESLRFQSYSDFEVVVAEDGESGEMAELVEREQDRCPFPILHTTQQDRGVRKSESQNRAVRTCTGDYLIFIDGDCIPYADFIEKHVLLSCDKCIVSGRRVNLGPIFSERLRNGELTSRQIESRFWWYFYAIAKDAKGEKHSEEGFRIKYEGLFHKVLKRRRKKTSLLGCNMSFYKKALYEINGFDEALENSALAGDFDLEWRFEKSGYHLVSAKYLANQFHLYHGRADRNFDRGMMDIIDKNMREGKVVCEKGLHDLSETDG